MSADLDSLGCWCGWTGTLAVDVDEFGYADWECPDCGRSHTEHLGER